MPWNQVQKLSWGSLAEHLWYKIFPRAWPLLHVGFHVQGSVLGPLLFLIYTNDLCKCLDYAKLIMFAENSTTFLTCDELSKLRKMMAKLGLKSYLLVLNIDNLRKPNIYFPQQKVRCNKLETFLNKLGVDIRPNIRRK